MAEALVLPDGEDGRGNLATDFSLKVFCINFFLSNFLFKVRRECRN